MMDETCMLFKGYNHICTCAYIHTKLPRNKAWSSPGGYVAYVADTKGFYQNAAEV